RGALRRRGPAVAQPGAVMPPPQSSDSRKAATTEPAVQSSDGRATAPELLRLTGIVKTFPGVRALDGVDLDIEEGKVHCLAGQNGAGKSTLIKVLAGVHKPDAGEIVWRGEPISFASPQAAMKAGIATIYQELDLVEDLTVADNIFLGHEQSAGGFVQRLRTRRDAAAVLARPGPTERPRARP